jgi:hypothetical protein
MQSELHTYRSLSSSLLSIARMGKSELLRGFVASSLRDAPYAGLFVVMYESIKRETSEFIVGDARTWLMCRSVLSPRRIFSGHSQFLSSLCRCYCYDGNTSI